MPANMMFRLAAAAALTVAAACATLERGMVLTGSKSDAARVRLGASDGVAVGSRVGFYDMRCEERLFGALGEREECDDVKVGGGTVVQVLDDTTSVVRPDPGVEFHWTQLVKPDAPVH